MDSDNSSDGSVLAAMMAIAVKDVAEEEGFSAFPYHCPAGRLTIGYGFNLEDAGMSREEADAVLAIRLRTVVEDLEQFRWWEDLDPVRQAALVNLHYAHGPTGFRAYKRMIEALEREDYRAAAREVLDSKFGRTHGNRARRVSDALRRGEA